nr:hypothetical protein [Tanacetum cinerariifolium]
MRVAIQESQGGIKFKDNDLKIKIQDRRLYFSLKILPHLHLIFFFGFPMISYVMEMIRLTQEDVNDAMRSKKKTVVVTSDPLDLIAEKTKVSKSKEKVVVSSDSEGSEADNFSELKKITALLAKAFNQKKFYSKPTNNNLRTSSTSQSANKKREFVKSDDKQVVKKADEKKET